MMYGAIIFTNSSPGRTTVRMGVFQKHLTFRSAITETYTGKRVAIFASIHSCSLCRYLCFAYPVVMTTGYTSSSTCIAVLPELVNIVKWYDLVEQ